MRFNSRDEDSNSNTTGQHRVGKGWDLIGASCTYATFAATTFTLCGRLHVSSICRREGFQQFGVLATERLVRLICMVIEKGPWMKSESQRLVGHLCGFAHIEMLHEPWDCLQRMDQGENAEKVLRKTNINRFEPIGNTWR